MGREFNYEIVERLGTLWQDGDYSKEVNVIRYNGAKPKLDIRIWRNGKMLKGICLTDEETEKLKEILEQI